MHPDRQCLQDGSLTPEITKDYQERTSLNGFRFSFAVIGNLILGAAVVIPIVNLAGDPHKGYSLVGLLFGFIMAATILTTFFAVRETSHAHEPKPKTKFFETFLIVFKTRPICALPPSTRSISPASRLCRPCWFTILSTSIRMRR